MDLDGFPKRVQLPNRLTPQQQRGEISCEFHRQSIERLATLCDDPVGLTCSMDVARRWGFAKEVTPYASFEAASFAVKEGLADAFLVPGAYPRLNAFIMDAELNAAKTFIMKIPALVLACLPDQIDSKFHTIFHHPAVTPLLAEIDMPWDSAIHASSNSEACRMLLARPTPSACVTNALCAAHFKLKTLKELRSGIAMPWICFEKKPSTDTPIGHRWS